MNNKKPSILNLFSTPIYSVNIGRKFSKEETLAIKNILKDCRPNSDNILSVSNYVLSDYNELKDLKSFILKHLHSFSDEFYGSSHTNKLEITQSWVNVTNKSQSHHRHSHPNSLISGVFYLNAIKDDKIFFFNPYRAVRQFKLAKGRRSNRVEYSDEVGFPIRSGDLIFFPSYIEHEVKVNNTDESRISMAFNTFPKGILGDNLDLTELKLT